MEMSDFETPCYILDLKQVEENYHSLLNAFRRIYPAVRVAYSYKTNYTPAICSLINKLGGITEVVSPVEYALAERIKADTIIYNGVYGDYQQQFICAVKGGMVNVDNYRQFSALKSIAESTGQSIKLGLRVNIDIGNGYTSRFGVRADSEDFHCIVTECEKSDFVSLAGLHCHVSYAREKGFWQERAACMLKTAEGLELDYIDLGGNMYGKMPPDFSRQFSDDIPSFDDYAEVIAPLFSRAYPDGRMELILEAGTPIAANAMSVLSKVRDIKMIDNELYALMDCSVFDLGGAANSRNVPITIYSNKATNDGCLSRNLCFVGCTCLENDILRRGSDSVLSVGDLVEFHNVGAYSLTMNPNFIEPIIPIYTTDGELVRRRASFDDVFGNFTI
ncbi:MAG: hypothetical protein K2O14_07445 [Oscillospiraceae bacterium]|nr:hypothetical protein [Oscillospiraceae bacterium]